MGNFWIRDEESGAVAHVRGDPNMSLAGRAALQELLKLAVERFADETPAVLTEPKEASDE